MNAELTYDSYTWTAEPLQIMVYVLDGLALLVLAGSIFCEGMIGIEMIQVLQATLFLIPTMGSIPSGLAPLVLLRYSNGYNFVFGDSISRAFTFSFILSAIGIQNEFLISFNLMFALLLIVIVISFFLKTVQFCYRKFKVGSREISTE